MQSLLIDENEGLLNMQSGASVTWCICERLGLWCGMVTVDSETLLEKRGLRPSECEVAGLGPQVSDHPGNRLMGTVPQRWRKGPWVMEVL